MLVISTNLSQLSDLNWVMRVNTLFLCLTASSGSDQSGANQVKIRIKLSQPGTGSDYYAWKILITGGRTCPDQYFQWLTDWLIIGVQNNSPHISPSLVDRNICPRNAGVHLIQQVNFQVTEISDRILWISHGYLVCRNSMLPPHSSLLTHLTSPQHLMRKTWNFPNRNMQPGSLVRGTRQTTHKEDFVAKTWE